MTEYTLEALVKLGMIEYALVASVDPCGSLLAEGIAECHYTGPQPVTISDEGTLRTRLCDEYHRPLYRVYPRRKKMKEIIL
jgi:hypothetical protein